MRRNTGDRSSYFLYLLAIDVVRDGAEPETKREGSADLLGGAIPSRASIHPVSGNLDSAVAQDVTIAVPKED
jgi:hypothetical protein